MKTSSLGTVFVIVGILMLAYTGFNFITTKRVVDIGPIKIDKEENHPVQWSPVVGVVLVVGGIALVLRDRKSGK
jgi:hypothetical protein